MLFPSAKKNSKQNKILKCYLGQNVHWKIILQKEYIQRLFFCQFITITYWIVPVFKLFTSIDKFIWEKLHWQYLRLYLMLHVHVRDCSICLLAWQSTLSKTVHFCSYTVTLWSQFQLGGGGKDLLFLRTYLYYALWNLLREEIRREWKHLIVEHPLLQFTSHLPEHKFYIIIK